MYNMTNISGLVKQLVEETVNKKIGLLNLEVKELKDESNELRKKYNLLNARVKKLESQIAESTDFGV